MLRVPHWDPPGGRLQLEEEVRVSDTLMDQPYQFSGWV